MNNNNENSNKDYEIVFAVTDIYDGNRKVESKWVRIGVMFPAKGGKPGHSIKLEALPIDWTRTSLVTRPPKPREDEAEAF